MVYLQDFLAKSLGHFLRLHIQGSDRRLACTITPKRPDFNNKSNSKVNSAVGP